MSRTMPGFDVGFIEQNCRSLGLSDEFVYLDTVALARVLLPTLSKYKLNIVAKALNISLENHTVQWMMQRQLRKYLLNLQKC